MGRLALVGNGWHPKLFREEARSLLGHVDTIHPHSSGESKDSVLEDIELPLSILASTRFVP